jgi:hypothetical protein
MVNPARCISSATGHHLVQRGGDQAGKADHVGAVLVGGLEDVLPRHHHAKVDDLEAVALQNHADDVLADVVDVALDGGHHHLAFAGSGAGPLLFRFDEGNEVGDGFLHHAGGFHHLRQEHLAGAEQVADDVHAVHQRAFDDVDRAPATIERRLAGFLGVLDHEGVDALDQSVFEPLADLPAAPFGFGLFADWIGAAILFGKCDEALGAVLAAIEDHVLAGLAQLGIDGVVDVELAGVDDRHVEAGRDGVVEEHRVHRRAHRLVAAEREGEVGEATRNVDVRAARLDLAAGLDEVEGVAAVLVDAGGDGEDVGVEDDVLGREAVGDEQFVGAAADFHLARPGVGLADFVEGHDDDRGAVVAALGGEAEELGSPSFMLIELTIGLPERTSAPPRSRSTWSCRS